jgi:DNA-binding response OmpR family regulator
MGLPGLAVAGCGRCAASGEGRPVVRCAGGSEVDLARHEVRRGRRTLSLTKAEWRLLQALADHPDEVVLHEELYARIWGEPPLTRAGMLKQLGDLVGRAREKLGPRAIVTLRGSGYRLRLAG